MADPAKHTGTMVALKLPAALAKKLAIEGGEPPSTMHITLAYLGKDLTDDQKKKAAAVVAKLASESAGLKVTLGGVGRFSASGTSEGKDVIYLSVDSPDVTEFRPKLVERLAAAGIETSKAHGFVPHVTLKYVSQMARTPLKRLDPVDLTVKDITLFVGEKQTKFKFTKQTEDIMSLRKCVEEAKGVLSEAPGKLTQKWDRGSRGADSFRTFTKNQTSRAMRRASKAAISSGDHDSAVIPKRVTKGYQHATWPSNPVYLQKLYDKKKTESLAVANICALLEGLTAALSEDE